MSEVNNWAIQSLIWNENESVLQQSQLPSNCSIAWIIFIFVATQIGVKINHSIQGFIVNT